MIWLAESAESTEILSFQEHESLFSFEHESLESSESFLFVSFVKFVFVILELESDEFCGLSFPVVGRWASKSEENLFENLSVCDEHGGIAVSLWLS